MTAREDDTRGRTPGGRIADSNRTGRTIREERRIGEGMERGRKRRDDRDAVCRTACGPAPASTEGWSMVVEGSSGGDHVRPSGPGAGKVAHAPAASPEE